MRKLLLSFLVFLSFGVLAKAVIDPDVIANFTQSSAIDEQPFTSILIFFKSSAEMTAFRRELETIPDVRVEELHFMPVIAAIIPKNLRILYKIANHRAPVRISSNKFGTEELESSAQAMLLKPSAIYPEVYNWWQNGYTGHSGVVGLIDSGVAIEHPALAGKSIIIRQESDSNYLQYKNGVRSPHGTGVACIYMGAGSAPFEREHGIAYGATTIVAGLAGGDDKKTPEEDLLLTYNTLDWMLTRVEKKPTVINYSFGNGKVSCPSCPDWSGLAKIVDYTVNKKKILWVKSAGNQGYVPRQKKAPFQSALTVPADNYNGITVANMNPTVFRNGIALQTPDRNLHAIRFTSSRGPTINGRKKPDLSAPGNDTRTCAPDPKQYNFNYATTMDYLEGYRLMGGTSSATPHVGGAVLLLQDAGIIEPMLVKALLINSADAWTDGGGKRGPDDPGYAYNNEHHTVMGSEWNATYGWGYINMQQAYDQRENLIFDFLTPEQPIKEFHTVLPVGAKLTVVHERRVGYNSDNSEWMLSTLALEIYDAKTHALIAQDNSSIDTVHQVANCKRFAEETTCSAETQEMEVIIRVKLANSTIDGSDKEPFALASTVPVTPVLALAH